MGIFNINCQISNTPITDEQEAVLIFTQLNYGPIIDLNSVTSYDRIISLPLFIIYDEYGKSTLNPKKAQENTLAIESLHQMANGHKLKSIKDESEAPWRNEIYVEPKLKELFSEIKSKPFKEIMNDFWNQNSISFSAVHQNIYDSIINNTLNNPLVEDNIIYNKNYIDAVINHYQHFSVTTAPSDEWIPSPHEYALRTIEPDVNTSSYEFYLWYYGFIEDALSKSTNNIKIITEASIFLKTIRKLNIKTSPVITTTALVSSEKAMTLMAEIENIKNDFSDLLYECDVLYAEIANVSIEFKRNVLNSEFETLEPHQIIDHLTTDQILQILANREKNIRY